jgi:enediyne biosynthesis protein E4
MVIQTAKMKLTLINLLFFIALSVSAQKKQTMFQELKANDTGVYFENKVIENANRSIGTYDYMYNGAGVAIGDLNNDGLPDLFFSGNDTPNKLYLNTGNLKFVDVSATAGIESNKWATGVTLVDINNDGWLDIYVCYSGPDFQSKSTSNELYINQKDETFKEAAAEWGIADNGLSTHAAFFDFDGDGDLDLFVLNHAIRNWANEAIDWFKQLERIPENELKRFGNAFYRNDGNEHFTNISESAGVNQIGFGLGVSVSDFDDNGFPDLYVSNDYFIPDRLYLNTGKGTFVESLGKKFQHTPFFSMGCDAADFNNDGLIDLMVLDMTPSDHYRNKVLMSSMNTTEFDFLTKAKGFVPQYMFNSLFMNNGSGVMSDIAHLAGVASTDWSWAPLLADFNNDGMKDLYVTNGFLRDVNNNDWRQQLLQMINAQQLTKDGYFAHLQKASSQPIQNQMYANKNGYEFDAVNELWGLNEASFSSGAAYGDLDADGDLDLVVSNIHQPAFILKNNSREFGNNFIQFKIKDSSSKNLHSGARFEVWQQGAVQVIENTFSRGYQSHSQPLVHFGLGQTHVVDSAVIHWSNGKVSQISKPTINKMHEIDFTDMQVVDIKKVENHKLFWDITDLAVKPAVNHIENIFNDFEKEVLLPHKMSRLGPALAVADVNVDGLDDFYLGGAKGHPGVLYIQNANGFFEPSQQWEIINQREREEIGALFFDSNRDGFPDLYVACAGNGQETTDSLLQDLLYVNDGRGNLLLSNALPSMPGSTKTVKAFDWDNDGDLDLFVGGRVVSGKYPLAPQSFLLENRDGKFIDVTFTLCPEIHRIGMITDAAFTTWNGSFRLFIVGEWMPVVCFEIDKNGWKRASDFEIPLNNGWWSSIAVADLNGDGRNDLLLGNIGLNNKFHPTLDKPLYLFANDMDDNGTLDIVLGKQYQNQMVPVRGKECSTQQMPYLSKKFSSYHDFASSSMIDIYGKNKLDESVSLQAVQFASLWVENLGKEGLDIQELPIQAQISPIQGFVMNDFDGDGIQDVLLAGNFFPTEVETTPYNSGKGLFLKGTKSAGFKVVNEENSGVFLPGDVRALLPISISSDKIPGIIVASNNGKLRLLMLNQSFGK